jgi:hypothetical protein
LNPKIEFGYGHEFASSQAKTYMGGSHEAQFKLKLGNQMKDLITKREENQTDSTDVAVAQAVPKQTEKTDSIETSPTQQEKVVAQTTPEEIKDTATPVTEPTDTKTEMQSQPVVANPVHQQSEVTQPIAAQNESAIEKPAEKYSLVIGTFSSSSNAIAFLRKARAKGLRCEMSFQEDTGYYYVFAAEYESEDPTVDQLLSIREKIPYKDAWFKKSIKKE